MKLRIYNDYLAFEEIQDDLFIKKLGLDGEKEFNILISDMDADHKFAWWIVMLSQNEYLSIYNEVDFTHFQMIR